MKLVDFNRTPTLEEALRVIDSLRRDVEQGMVVGFFVAAFDDKDATIVYCASTKPATNLRMQGAMSQALHDYQAGKLLEEV